jgi:transglutaminase-like putative cysteine protease
MQPFLQATEIVDWHHPDVTRQATVLQQGEDIAATARACFTFVRDEIRHSGDYRLNPVTCRASDVLRHATGYCYAKSHLLAALLRANDIPAGFCYQRLSVGDLGPPFSLHGFNAIHLPESGWYRVDPRGNKPGVDAQFDPPRERLAFTVNSQDEFEFENIFPEPLNCVLAALRQSRDWQDALHRLPDVSPGQFDEMGIVV